MSGDFSPEQKRYLEGFTSGLQAGRAARTLAPGTAGAVERAFGIAQAPCVVGHAAVAAEVLFHLGLEQAVHLLSAGRRPRLALDTA